MQWTQASTGKQPKKLVYTLSALSPNTNYQIMVNGFVTRIKSDTSGSFVFNSATGKTVNKIVINKR